ncbi:putative leucine-rich repeat receptor-like serine/threonine-protein kinase At2g19230 [Chenopodium quinoa]|uniref:putative leucine-rich repeat receptor-like serine/threonine-protein kinase At2g19230 n=1 Tax=Chenopodium quinoa TaxID=63459 RepID=UPI000B77003E|nr:putative leucine-rich repeat receptor-like serine/threonine-protein kinase At2g19230 [Chenopodium quinoa]
MLRVWVMALKTINILMLCLLIYNYGLLFSLAADDAANWTLLANKRVAAGFISIDCGMTTQSRYDNTGGLHYISDSGFIKTGINREVDSTYSSYNDDGGKIYNTVRSFPDGIRNCYTLKPLQGKNRYYLIRASFLYGNYDGSNTIPKFDVYIGVHFWTTIFLNDGANKIFVELIYTPSEDWINVCLVKTGSTTPFISALELNPLNDSIYTSSDGALLERARMDAGFFSNTYISVADDPYDRLWRGVPANFQQDWGSLNTSQSMDSTFIDRYELPPSVLKTVAFPLNSTIPLNYYYRNMGSSNTGLVRVYWHFAEIQKLGSNESREFTISIPGKYQSETISPKYLQPLTIVSPVITLINGSGIVFHITKTKRSKLPPILNAFEIYEVVDLSALPTDQNDVNAIMNIKMNYSVPESWQGDPCLPYVPWDGLECSSNDHNSPRITSLNLTFSGLAGDIPLSLSALTALTYLDLSYNNLTGAIPDFLAKMPSLHTIDLRSNMLTGPVPIALSKKVEDGSVILRLEGNPDVLCMSNPCKKKNSKKMVAILSSTACITFIFISIAILICILKRKKAARYIKNAALKLESRSFTYAEVMRMTNNFQTIIGKGGSGAVYQGSLHGTLVAVKMINPSTHSLKLFRTEAELLTRVHHRCLVSLIGYCEEGATMALIYEHVTNGNLQQYISVADKNNKVLCWKERLQIAIDAAQGLEYMHSGCKPPIVHRDMKTSNILLDENMHAKISDFGISKSFSIESTESGLNTKVMGTHGYVDPEYYSTERLNKKSDVFSFGVVLLELITGQSPIVKSNNAEPIHIITWTTPKLESGDIELIVDKRLEGHFSTNSAWKALEIAMMCVSSTAIQRPTMNQVLSDLNDCLAIEISQGKNREMDSHEYGYPTTDIAIPDTSIEMGPTAR